MVTTTVPVVPLLDRRAELLISTLDRPLSSITGAVDSGSGRRRA